MLHRTTPLKMWRSLNHWRDTLSDPTFLLAATHRDTLPHELEVLSESPSPGMPGILCELISVFAADVTRKRSDFHGAVNT